MLWSVPTGNYLAQNVKCVKASPDLEENLVPELALHTYNPNTREAKEGGFQVWGHPELHDDILSQKNKN